MMAAQKILVGSTIQIDLSNAVVCYGQVVSKAEIAFFNYFGKPKSAEAMSEIYSRPVLFVISVMNSAIKSGRWPVVDRTELSEELKRPRNYFIQDKITKQISIYKSDDGSMRPAGIAEIDGLECAAVWDAEHVEDRLRDHHMGQKNVWTEQLKPVS